MAATNRPKGGSGVNIVFIVYKTGKGGARLVIRNGENGLLVPVENRKKLTEAMLRLIKNPEYAERLGTQAEKVRTAFSSEKICRKWELLMEQTVFGKKAAKKNRLPGEAKA